MARGKFAKISLIHLVLKLLKCELVKGICLNTCIANTFKMFSLNAGKILNTKKVTIMNFDLHGLITVLL